MPSIGKVRWGFDFSTSERNQTYFLRNILISLFSISASGNLDFAWSKFKNDISTGKLHKAKSLPKLELNHDLGS